MSLELKKITEFLTDDFLLQFNSKENFIKNDGFDLNIYPTLSLNVRLKTKAKPHSEAGFITKIGTKDLLNDCKVKIKKLLIKISQLTDFLNNKGK